MIAVPGTSQFFGAMENWGAIMYFEQALLLDPRLSSESDRLNVYDAVAHEMAHQWFGNLVTMEWWDDLWLNEGYATWMAEKAATTLRPQWNVPLLTVKWPREYALQSDASDATHPVVQPVVSVDAGVPGLRFDRLQQGQRRHPHARSEPGRDGLSRRASVATCAGTPTATQSPTSSGRNWPRPRTGRSSTSPTTSPCSQASRW